jgi:hypothetical protein
MKVFLNALCPVDHGWHCSGWCGGWFGRTSQIHDALLVPAVFVRIPGWGGPATLQGITEIVKRKTNQQEKAQSTDVVTDTSLPNRPLDPQRSVFALEHLGVRYRGKRQSGESAEISQRGTGREAPSHSASSHAYRLLGAALVPKARLLYRSRHIRRQCWSTPHTET